MSQWPSTKARVVYKALLKTGWTFLRQVGSHKKLSHPNFPNYTWSFADSDELGSAILSRIAKKTGLKPADL
ncbi:MAG: type II toxin-antitoxin system HicA family toxin [Candidatus Sulfotelmatobacter sp.]